MAPSLVSEAITWSHVCLQKGHSRKASLRICRDISMPACTSEPPGDFVHVTCAWHMAELSQNTCAHACVHTHTHTHLIRPILERIARCVLMRNSWSGSVQIKDIHIRELPPVFPSCSAASKWVPPSLAPAGVASSLPGIDREPHPCAAHRYQTPRHRWECGRSAVFPYYSSRYSQTGSILVSCE